MSREESWPRRPGDGHRPAGMARTPLHPLSLPLYLGFQRGSRGAVSQEEEGTGSSSDFQREVSADPTGLWHGPGDTVVSLLHQPAFLTLATMETPPEATSPHTNYHTKVHGFAFSYFTSCKTCMYLSLSFSVFSRFFTLKSSQIRERCIPVRLVMKVL